jgi:hypothetical protein
MRAACGGDVKVEAGAARSGADDRMLTRKYLGEARPNGQQSCQYTTTPTEVAHLTRTSRYQYDRYAWYHTVTCLFRGSTTT